MTTDSELKGILAETIHAAFRKGCEEGLSVHAAITKMPNAEWAKAIDWMLWALNESGYKIVRKDET